MSNDRNPNKDQNDAKLARKQAHEDRETQRQLEIEEASTEGKIIEVRPKVGNYPWTIFGPEPGSMTGAAVFNWDLYTYRIAKACPCCKRKYEAGSYEEVLTKDISFHGNR